MSDQIPPTTGAAPAPSANDAANAKPVGKPLQAPRASEGGGQSQQPETAVPLSQIEPIIEKVLDRYNKAQQSQRDRMEARINQRINGLRAVGIEPTPDQVNKIAMQVQSEDLPPNLPDQGRPSPAAEQAVSAPDQPGQGATNPLDIVAASIMSAEGVEIDEADPEARLVDWTDAKTVYASVRRAVEAKRARIANASTPIVGGLPAGTNPIANINDPYELLSGAFKGK